MLQTTPSNTIKTVDLPSGHYCLIVPDIYVNTHIVGSITTNSK